MAAAGVVAVSLATDVTGVGCGCGRAVSETVMVLSDTDSHNSCRRVTTRVVMSDLDPPTRKYFQSFFFCFYYPMFGTRAFYYKKKN